MFVFKNIRDSFTKFLLIAGLLVTLGFAPAAQAQTGARPSLFVVAAGVSRYVDMKPLHCAHKDALDMARMFQSQQGKMFGQVQAATLTDSQATAGNILNSIRWAAAQAQADSCVIVYLAGHGGKPLNGTEYGFCAFDKNITWSQIQNELRRVPGKVIVILDTCQAGAVTGGGNLVVFCGSLAHQGGGEELNVNGNGWFTRSLLEALRGRADVNGDGIVTLDEVESYVAARVHQISGGTQNSLLLRPYNLAGSLPLTQLAPATPLPPQHFDGMVPVAARPR